MYRYRDEALEVFLVHPGGPFWARKDPGAWSIPKGEHRADEDPLAAACREFREETGLTAEGPFRALIEIRQKGGKYVQAYAFEGDADPRAIRSNTFTMEWPPRSGQQQEFPEVDRAAWFGLEEAREKILAGQRPLLDELEDLLVR
jgi:predicted NUDIX family NTP pyrophosphohydrolase